ncbi:hypothetical protein ACFE04_023882 [Oxalis oulophora]
MSDSCFYKLEDNVWDDFGMGDDHIVPNDEYKDQFAFAGDSEKKPKYEVNCTGQGKNENGRLPLTNKDIMLEKGSWSHSPDDEFPASSDNQQVKEVANPNIDSVSNESSADDSILDDKCTDLDNNIYRLPLNNNSQTDNDLSFLDNDCEHKQSSELLYYNLPEIGNFEDIDRMFRNCDSTFGLGNNEEDDLGWFSASGCVEGFEDPLKSSPQFLNVSKHCEDYKPNNQSSSSVQALSHMSFTKGEMKPNTQHDDVNNAQPLHQEKLGAKRGDLHQGSADSLHQQGHLNQFLDVKHPFRNSSKHAFHSDDQLHEQNMGLDSLRYMQTHSGYMDLDYRHTSEQVSVTPTLSSMKSQKNESSYASNEMDISNVPSRDTPSKTTNHRGQRVHKNRSRNSTVPSDSKTAQKQVLQFEHDMENQNAIEEGSMSFPTDLDSSNVPESSCMSSVLNDISLEAASFRQLQQVTEKLDLRTKLCIRDSLYRLAKSAEQRHNIANPNGRGALIAGEPNSALIDIETNTNPIDRSIAHLLFHRPSDGTVVPPTDSLLLKSNVMVHESVTGLTEAAEKKTQHCQEETAVMPTHRFHLKDSVFSVLGDVYPSMLPMKRYSLNVEVFLVGSSMLVCMNVVVLSREHFAGLQSSGAYLSQLWSYLELFGVSRVFSQDQL